MIEEIWRKIPEFDGYEVSNFGRVRSYRKRGTKNLWYISDMPQRILQPGIKKKSRYKFVHLPGNDGEKHLKHVHTLVALVFLGPCPEGLEICHKDFDSLNNRVDNLEYNTHAYNMEGKGSKYATKEQVSEMKELYKNGLTVKQLSIKYNISPERVSGMLRYKNNGSPVFGKLTKRAEAIKLEHSQGATYKELAIKYNLAYRSVYRIVKNGLVNSP